MSTKDVIELQVELNPWGKSASPSLPDLDQLQLVCRYEVSVGIAEFDEAAFLHRTPTHDELWACDLDNPPVSGYLSARAPRGGSAAAAAVRLFRQLVRSRTGFAWPSRWWEGDLIDEATFQQAVDSVKAGLARNARGAKRREAPIVQTARRLGLDPTPSGTSPTAWRAHCPGTNHSLMIGTESNTFGCGYCRRKGGPQELEAFVEDRRLYRVKGGR